jgi:hypothetical protein
LSFPILDPIAYKPEDLNLANALSSAEVGHALADLSLNVNSLPTGILFQGAGDNYLWDTYDQWLNDMVLAKDQMTADERAQYNQANALLTVKDANGFSIDSPIVVAYKQYRDAWFTATQNYKNEQLTASLSSDPAVQNQWKNVEEPHLRALVDQANSDWENKGNKAEVEAAQAVVTRLDARSPSSVWTKWDSALIPDLDLPTDPVSNMQYAPTGFSPTDLFAQDWPTFHLSSNEIAQLTQSAPDELRKIFSEGGGASTITSLSFEFRSAALVRPWLNTAVFNARFWKFREGTPPLSDGAVSPQGSWPSYISAVVFARNIQVTTQAAPQPQPWRTLPAVNPAILRQPPPPKPIPIKEPPELPVKPGMGHLIAGQRFAAPMMMAHSVTPASATAMVPGKVQVSPVMRLMLATYRAPTLISQPASASSGASLAGSSSQSAPSTTNPDVSILAFICRRLPQTPNPDPSLNWGP